MTLETNTSSPSTLAALSAQLADVVARVGPSVVRVDDGSQLTATGIVWTEDGVVLTTSHGVERDDDLTAKIAAHRFFHQGGELEHAGLPRQWESVEQGAPDFGVVQHDKHAQNQGGYRFGHASGQSEHPTDERTSRRQDALELWQYAFAQRVGQAGGGTRELISHRLRPAHVAKALERAVEPSHE